MNYEALKSARLLINKNLGDISDLSDEMQSTIVNFYYKLSTIAQQGPHKFAFREDPKGPAVGLRKGLRETIFYAERADTIPTMISEIRRVTLEGDKKDAQFLTEVFLFIYKYKIENVSSKSYFRLKVEKFFRMDKIDQIPDLHKQKIPQSDYETFEDWYKIFVQVCGEENPDLKVSDAGVSLIDSLEHDPLERAFRDGIDPKSLAVDYAKQFDISALKMR